MNRYGRMALEHWRRHRPLAFSQIAAPQEFFTSLGEQVADQIEEISEQLLAETRPMKEFMQEVARREQAQQMAEEQVLTELVLLQDEETEALLGEDGAYRRD